MKKLLLILFCLFFFIIFIYPQALQRGELINKPIKEKINFPLDKHYKVSAESFSESFESSTFPPTGWSLFNSDGGTGWSRQTVGSQVPGWNSGTISTPSGGGNAVAYCTYTSGTTFNNKWLITPLIQNIQASDTLFFWMINQTDFSDSLSIEYSTDFSHWNKIFTFYYPANNTNTNWSMFFLAIGKLIPAGSNVYIGFVEHVLDNSIDGGAISLDLVKIKGTPPYPTSITLNNTFSFTDLSTSSYRMIGLPGNQTTKISDMISGTPKKDWDVFFDNGAASDFLKEFDGGSTFNFTPGVGFWVLSKNAFTVNATVNTVNLSADNRFTLNLHSGFNIISNPFEKSVSWTDIQNLNGLTTNDVLFDWSGVWTHATQMDPYKGYYFKNTNNLTSLKIPYNFAAAKISNMKSAENYSGNFLKLSLFQNGKVKSFTVAGFNSSAKKDYDKLDIFAPPGYFDDVRIDIEDQNLSDTYKQLSVDYRPSINEGQSFDLKIKNLTKQTVKLIADGIENFSNYEVYLVDKNLNKFYNLKEQNEISLSPIHENNNYQLLIGNENYIDRIKKGNIPTEYALYQNYPNPFNPSTVIKYQIPDNNTSVELKIYNILGKEVKTLVNEIQNSGIYEVLFNAANYSSGIYFCTIKAGSFSATKKMILLK